MLHFSGHGRENVEGVPDYILNMDKGDMPVLEDESGMSDLYYEQNLKQLVHNCR